MPRSKSDGAGPPLPVVGWREWVSLPDLGVEHIKAKIDTGARTSALHAHAPERYRQGGKEWIRFVVHPLQRRIEESVICSVEIVEEREIRSSTGHKARRPVVRTPILVAGMQFDIELTLASRDTMGFRMLLGRQALRRRFAIDPGRSFLGGTPLAVRRARKARAKKKREAREAEERRRG
jgi:hypothetical protein